MTLALKNTETEPVPTHRGAHPEIAPSATRSAPAAEPNDLLPALDSGREKLLSSTEVESTLKDWPTQEQASLKEQAEEKAASEVAIAAAAEDAEEMELKAAAKRLRRLRKNQKMEEEATEWLARTLALVLQQAQSSEPPLLCSYQFHVCRRRWQPAHQTTTRTRPCRACPGKRLQAPRGSMIDIIDSDSASSRIGIYDPSY